MRVRWAIDAVCWRDDNLVVMMADCGKLNVKLDGNHRPQLAQTPQPFERRHPMAVSIHFVLRRASLAQPRRSCRSVHTRALEIEMPCMSFFFNTQ